MLLFGLSLAALPALALLHAALTPEKPLMRLVGADPAIPVPPGVVTALQMTGETRVRILVFPDTLPKAYVVRRLGGPGKLLLSQGLLIDFGDDELLAVLIRGKRLLSETGICWRSSCAGWLARLQPMPSVPWTPFQALSSWMLFPLRSFLETRYRSLDLFASGPIVTMPETAWLSALHKASRIERVFSRTT